MITLGVLADTHVPDRARNLAPVVLAEFQAAGVEAILHAGDVSVPGVLEELEQIAPVIAVQGNRDIFKLRNLPLKRVETWSGVKIGLTHGHAPWHKYLLDRLHFMKAGYHHERLIPRLLDSFSDVDVIVFGHGHFPLNQRHDGRLLFNPGSPHFPGARQLKPSIGFLHISSGDQVRAHVHYLE